MLIKNFDKSNKFRILLRTIHDDATMARVFTRPVLLWIISFLITAASGIYQRVTGPSYPFHGKAALDGTEFSYTLARSHGGPSDHTVTIPDPDSSLSGTVEWRRYRSADAWSRIPMLRRDATLAADLPHQPPAGKIEYRVLLRGGGQEAALPPEGAVVIRFKGDVPLPILILHVAAMFSGMLLSTRAGLECISPHPRYKTLVYPAIGFLLLGGAVMGPLMQRYAFGAFWTGWPLGSDLTDNKTALALLSWIAAALALRRSKSPKGWILAAAIITLAVYLIPHSVLGSELEYTASGQGRP